MIINHPVEDCCKSLKTTMLFVTAFMISSCII